LNIWFDKKTECLCFKMEKKDWRGNRGKKFLNDIKILIPEDGWLAEARNEKKPKELVWMIEAVHVSKFYELFKQYYPAEAEVKTILFQ